MSTKTIITEKTSKIYNAILAADAIIIANSSLKEKVKVIVWSEVKGDADNEVLYFQSDDCAYTLRFTEESLEEAFVDNVYPNELILIDHKGEEIAITINKLVPIDPANLVYEGEGGVNKRA